MATHKSVETKYLEERQQFFHGLQESRPPLLPEGVGGGPGRDGRAGGAAFVHAGDRGAGRGEFGIEAGLSLRLYLGLALVREERQRPFRAGAAPRGRRREQTRPAARLRLLWRRPGATRSGHAARVGRPDPQESQGPVEDHGRRARLVSRSGPEVAGVVRQTDLLLRPQGGPLRRSQQRGGEATSGPPGRCRPWSG